VENEDFSGTCSPCSRHGGSGQRVLFEQQLGRRHRAGLLQDGGRHLRQRCDGGRAGHLGLHVRGRFPGERFPGYTVTPTASKGPGNAVCQGMPGGEYPATVTGPTGSSEDTECTFPGFSPAP
jgi:hypothetical protein